MRDITKEELNQIISRRTRKGKHSSFIATDRQMDILRMIDNHIKKYGFPPTRAEISRYFDFNSKNSATDFVNNLAKKEYLDLFTNVSRGLRITKKGKRALKKEGRKDV